MMNPLAKWFDDAAVQLSSAAESWQPTSDRQLVADFPLCSVYRYDALPTHGVREGAQANRVVFIVYAMVNTASILDLKDKLSTIQRMQQQGLTVYLMEWKPPQTEQSDMGLAEYLQQSLHVSIQAALKDSGLTHLNLMGVCQGGVFALCYAAMYPGFVRSVIPVVTPVNFQTEHDTLSYWVRHIHLAELMMPGVNVPGKLLAQVFVMLKPMTLSIRKYMDVAHNVHSDRTKEGFAETFMAMEQWIENTPDQPAQCFKEFVEAFYQQNALYEGTLRLAEQRIDLRTLTMPLLNVYASKDHLVPPESSKGLKERVPAALYRELEVPTGHIGMFVSRSALSHVPKAIADFIKGI